MHLEPAGRENPESVIKNSVYQISRIKFIKVERSNKCKL